MINDSNFGDFLKKHYFPHISISSFILKFTLFSCLVFLINHTGVFAQARIGSTEAQIKKEYKTAVKIFDDQEDKVYEIKRDTCHIRHYLVNNIVTQTFIIPQNMVVLHNFAEKFNAEYKALSQTEWIRNGDSGNIRILLNNEGRLYYYLIKKAD